MLASVSSAWGATRAELADELQGEWLSPSPLFPRALPSRLAQADGELDVTGNNFSVTWSRPGNAGFVIFDRGPRGQLADALRTSRIRGYRPRKRRVGRRIVYLVCGHNCAYVWREQGKTYGIGGVYYRQGNGPLFVDMRIVIRQLAVLH